jgi:hypothetical protein
MPNSQLNLWENDARGWGLSSQHIEQLKLHGVLITDQSFKQVFEPYIENQRMGQRLIGNKQVFITSDTVIQAYAVLLQDAVNQLDLQMAAFLKPYLIQNWAGLLVRFASQPANRPDYISALEHAMMVSGTALHLITGSIEGPPNLLKQIKDETERVKAASAQLKPTWMGPKDPGFLWLDYSRFNSRGFYVGHPVLEPYFQAVSWLQAIPFRFDNDLELLSFTILLEELVKIRPIHLTRFSSVSSQLLGPPDCVDLFHLRSGSAFAHIFGFNPQNEQKPSRDDPQFLQRFRQTRQFQEWRAKSKMQINDQVSDLSGIVEPSMRFISGRSLPENIYFSKTEARRGDFPSGLEISTALGSPVKCRAELQPLVEEELRPLLEPQTPSLYARFLKILELVFLPDPLAPRVFHGEAWAIKSLQTVLAGWVHQRHIWIHHSKQNQTSLPTPAPHLLARIFHPLVKLIYRTVF